MAAITSYATFTAALAALSVTGVTRKFAYPPASVGTADLPAMYPALPRGIEGGLTFVSNGGWPALFCDLIVLLEPVGQNTQSGNYAATIAMIDNVSAALRSSDIGRAKLNWETITNVQVDVAGTPYWAVITTVEAR